MLRWYPDTLLRVVLELTLVPVAFLSIFAIKTIVDPTTPWRIGTWQGPGVSDDFWKLTALLALGWVTLVLGWRGAKQTFKLLIVPWHLSLTAAAAAAFMKSEDFAVQGAAIGFSVTLGILAPVVAMTALACTIVWTVRDLRRGGQDRRTVSPMQRRNRIAGWMMGAGITSSAIGFAADSGSVGVLAGIAAMIAAREAIRPVNPSAEIHRAFVVEGSALE